MRSGEKPVYGNTNENVGNQDNKILPVHDLDRKDGSEVSLPNGDSEEQKKSRELFARLAQIAREGSEDEKKAAREEACQKLEKYIHSIIRHRYASYLNEPGYYDDLMIAALCGIIEGLPKYDPERGLPLTYFHLLIKNEMTRETCLMRHGITTAQRTIQHKIEEVDKNFEKCGRVPTVADYAVMIGKSIEIIENVLQSAAIGAAQLEDESFDLENVLGNPVLSHYINPETAYIQKTALKLLFTKMEQKFSEKDWAIFRHYLDGERPSQIATILGQTVDHVRTSIETCRKRLKYDPEIRNMFELDNY